MCSFYERAPLTIRATKLETYWTCPFRYRFEPIPDEDAVHFKLWTMIHKYIELALIDQVNNTTTTLLFYGVWVKDRLMAIKMWNLFVEEVKQKGYTLVCSERTNKELFDELNITLQGTFDHLFINQEWEHVLVDAKTAKSRWTEEHIEWVKQFIIYPALLKKYWINVVRFEYWVMTKTSNPQMQIVVKEVPEDSLEQTVEIMSKLRDSEDRWIWEPNFPNHSCHYCMLREQCRAYKPIT